MINDKQQQKCARKCVIPLCQHLSSRLFSVLLEEHYKNTIVQYTRNFKIKNRKPKQSTTNEKFCQKITMEILDSFTPQLCIEQCDKVLDAISKSNVRAKIPLVSNLENFNQLSDGQLVRFRGLVQNMYDPEIYLEQYQVKDSENVVHTRNGKYRDSLKLKVI